MTKSIIEAKTAVTHNGKFHADEVFATAVLQTINPNLHVQRSRDLEVIRAADVAYDVGGVYDHASMKYDHHQHDPALKRTNGMTRSALGLIWLHYGIDYCNGDERAARRIDELLIAGVDARDNGESTTIDNPEAPDYGISQVIEQLNPILAKGETYDGQFQIAVGRAADILGRLHDKVKVELEDVDYVVECVERSDDQRYVVLDRQITPSDEVSGIEQLLYVVFPETTNNTWQVYATYQPGEPFVQKRSLPIEWAGCVGDDMARVSGVSDALFCHKKRFLAVAKSRDGALALLAQALK